MGCDCATHILEVLYSGSVYCNQKLPLSKWQCTKLSPACSQEWILNTNPCLDARYVLVYVHSQHTQPSLPSPRSHNQTSLLSPRSYTHR